MKDFLLYGLQRSGTNYLTTLLETNFEARVVIDDYTYSLPIHKHFRPYSKPWFFSHLNLLHDFHYETFNDFDAHCSRLKGKKDINYLVIAKEPYSWYFSFNRFARKEKIFYFMKKKYLNHLYMIEYSNYFRKWLEFRDQAPDRIKIVRYEDLLMNLDKSLDDIRNSFDLQKKAEAYQNVSKVGMSKKFTESDRQKYLEGKFHKKFTDEQLLLISEHLDNKVVEQLGYQVYYPDGIEPSSTI